MTSDLKRKRECDECSECCKGSLYAEIYGKYMDKGQPCHYLGKNGCTIYVNRPEVCSSYKCEWLRDDSTNIPEWMRPDMSKVIITERSWGPNHEHVYWQINESGQKIDSTILNWIYMYISAKNICADIQVDSRWYQMGPPEFADYVNKTVSRHGYKSN